MRNKYQPIDCHFHDVLLDRATRNRTIDLVYLLDGNLQCKKSTIKDVYTKKGEEFMLLSDGGTVRLDQIKSVDGMILKHSDG